MRKTLTRYFFLLVFASEASAWVRAARGNSLKVAASASAFSSGTSDPVLLLLNVFVVLAGLVIAYPKMKIVLGLVLQERALLAIYVYSFLSVLWADNVGNSFRIALYLFFGFIEFTYIGWILDAEDQILTLSRIVTFLALVSIPGQFLLPAAPDPAPGWTGIFLSKNYLGNVLAMGIIATLLRKDRWSVTRAMQLVICVPLLFLSQSFTAVLCVAVCGAIILFLRLTRQQKILLVGAGTSVLVLVSVLLPNFLSLLLGASGKDTTLTGRDVIWRFALKYIALRPFFGYGYYGFWLSQEDAALEYLGWNPQQAHNGFIDLALNEGLIGLGILLTVFFIAIRRSIRQIRAGDPANTGEWSLIMLVYLLVHNVSEADFYQRPAWAVFLVSYIASAKSDLPVRYEPQDTWIEERDESVFSESPPQPALV